jgi:CRISPR/Cas system-associated exonuclease Cas4 (RecB family)
LIIKIKKADRKRKHWTPTDLKTHEGCPARYARRYELGLPTFPSKALDRGNDVHKIFEDRLNSQRQPEAKYAALLKPWEKEIKQLIRAKAIPEQLWSIDKNWKPIQRQRGQLWARMKTDAHLNTKHFARVIDYKTGRIYPDHSDLMEIYAVAASVRFPTTPQINVELWYIDQEEIVETHYQKEKLEKLREGWSHRAQSVLDAEEFPETPSEDACRFCDFRKEKGGQCKSR